MRSVHRLFLSRVLGGFVAGWRIVLMAIIGAISCLLFFPTIASAHAVLLRSDPAQDAVLHVPPDYVHLWFSEALNPTFSTVLVENAVTQQRVDRRDAQLSPDNPSEMDVTLQAHLPPGVYVVIWRSDSNDDGHIESDSFLFTVAHPDGTLPQMPAHLVSGGGGPSVVLTFFSALMITLLELGAVFWVGTLCWLAFVLPSSTTDGADEEMQAIHQQVRVRFERRFALPTLMLLLLANTGVLLSQAVGIGNGQWESAFALSLLVNLVTSSTFGLFWLIRELLLLLALRMAFYLVQFKTGATRVSSMLGWANLVLGLVLFTTIALTSHAAAVKSSLIVEAVMADWFHLLAAALWIGGMMAIAALYVPILHTRSTVERTRSLMMVLPSFTPWAVSGVILMAITGPMSASTQFSAWEQLLTTLYGQLLLVKIFLISVLLVISTLHVFVYRPRLKRIYTSYTATAAQLDRKPASVEPEHQAKLITHQMALYEKQLAKQTQRLLRILRWEPGLGIAILMCVGLMNVFAGTLAPVAPSTTLHQQPSAIQQPFYATIKTFDREFTVTLEISPNQLGTNVFTVGVANLHTGEVVTNIKVDVNTEMQDMDMGIGFILLKPDGHERFTARGDLAMSGHWQIIVQISTPNDPYHVHEAYVTLVTS